MTDYITAKERMSDMENKPWIVSLLGAAILAIVFIAALAIVDKLEGFNHDKHNVFVSRSTEAQAKNV